MLDQIACLLEKAVGCVLWYLVDYFSADPTSEYFPLNHKRHCLQDLASNFPAIRKEILRALPLASSIQGDTYFQSDITDDGKWKKIYMKWYAPPPAYAYNLFPHTMRVIDRNPDIRLAMVSKLEPWARIKPHRGVYRGSIRVHVGIQTPNSSDCFISVNHIRYAWRDGEMVCFDDTYEHFVENNTPFPRIVLFLDIDRHMKFSWAQACLRFISDYICPLTTRKNEDIEPNLHKNANPQHWNGGMCG